ncbi:MAG: GatB/YqeY domain-containing protein [Streptosporangiales bacterium]|nr:GatB/YqeY domain-containing protein [Streptosporangiales bacterium]
MASLKEQLQQDLTAAIKARDEVSRSTIRMALTAVNTEEVAGAASRSLTDDEVLAVLAAEAKRRRESADVYTQNGRVELAERELVELEVLERYLPKQLGDDELGAVIDEVIAETGADSPKQMGAVMKAVLAKVGNQADGKRVSALVKAKLTG